MQGKSQSSEDGDEENEMRKYEKLENTAYLLFLALV